MSGQYGSEDDESQDRDLSWTKMSLDRSTSVTTATSSTRRSRTSCSHERPTTRTSLSHIERTARTSLEALTVRTAYPQLSAPKRKSKIGFYDDDNMVPE
jgi:hypothetical protein